jgi:hypothetical protein
MKLLVKKYIKRRNQENVNFKLLPQNNFQGLRFEKGKNLCPLGNVESSAAEPEPYHFGRIGAEPVTH